MALRALSAHCTTSCSLTWTWRVSFCACRCRTLRALLSLRTLPQLRASLRKIHDSSVQTRGAIEGARVYLS